MHLLTVLPGPLIIFLIPLIPAVPSQNSRDSPRLGWDFWLNPHRPAIHGPIHVADIEALSNVDQPIPVFETTSTEKSTFPVEKTSISRRPTAKPATTKRTTVKSSTAEPPIPEVPDFIINKAPQCGSPKIGHYDPFSLSDANLAAWDMTKDLATERRNLSVAMTIVGGQDTDPEKVCWQAKLQKDNRFICGASIIGKRTVLTASHCVNDFRTGTTIDAKRIRISVGAPLSSTNVEKGTKDPKNCSQDFGVVKVIAHAKFNRITNENDVAIIKLEEDIDLSRRCACPICLSHHKPTIGEICAVSGYGLEQEGGGARNPRPMKFVHLNVKKTDYDSNCYIQGFGSTKPDLKNLLCAGDVLGKDTCQGDSGGPMVCMDAESHKHYQAGIVSYGQGCARGVGGIYTRISSYMNWILENSDGDILGLLD